VLNADAIVPAAEPETKVPRVFHVVPSLLYSQSCCVKPVFVLCAAKVTESVLYPDMLNLKTMTFPFAVEPTRAKAAGLVVVVDREVPAVLTVVPPKASSSAGAA
jgi:hypothetical protein